jgi:transposase
LEHLAIDLGGRESQICVRSSDGTVLLEERRSTRQLKAFLRKRPTSRVIVETCAEAFAVADAALEMGHEVRVVPATLVRSLGVGSRGVKTDRRDAQVLSEVSCRIDLPSVHVPSQEARRRKTLCGMREALVSARTQMINSVRGWLRTELRQVATGGSESFPHRVRRHFAENSPTPTPTFVERQLQAIEDLNEQIGGADQELSELAMKDTTCTRLMTVPGVGPVTSIRFVAAIDDVSRFAGAHQVESYLGLVPGEDSSSERKRRTGITKAGSPALRRALAQAAWSLRHCRRADPLKEWAAEVEKRRGKHIATTALMRKLAGILYALWRDGSVYDPQRGAMPR